MVSRKHEGPIALIKKMPRIVPSLLATVGLDVPEDAVVRIEPTDLGEMNPTELRADLVATVRPSTGAPVSVIVEVQRAKDPEKKLTWPSYLAELWRRTGTPVVLLVVCFDAKTAAWAGESISMGPRAAIRPSALSPEKFPPISDIAKYDGSIETAVFGALMHADGPEGRNVLETLMVLLDEVEVEQADRYIRFLDETMSFHAKAILEVLMTAGTYEFQGYSDKRYAQGRDEGRDEARIETEQEAVVNVLAARGIVVGAEALERIHSCRDFDLLKSWLIRAATVNAVGEIFA